MSCGAGTVASPPPTWSPVFWRAPVRPFPGRHFDRRAPGQESATTPQDGDSWLAGLARASVEHGDSTYWVAMAILGVGSVAFCRALLHAGLLPRLLAMGGI